MAFNYFPDLMSGKISAPKFQIGITPVPSERQLFSLFELPSQNTPLLNSSGSIHLSPFDFRSGNLRRVEPPPKPRAPNKQGFRKSLVRYSPLPQFYLFLKVRRNNSAPIVRSRWTDSGSKSSNEKAFLSKYSSPVRKRGQEPVIMRNQGFSQHCPARSSPALLDGLLISPKDLSIKIGEQSAQCSRS